MKRVKKIISFVLATALFSTSSIGGFSTNEEISYYNINPKIWSKEENHQVKVDMCQIDSEQLKTMSTDELVKACLEYPLIIDMFAYDTVEDGFNSILNQSNAFKEMVKRNDTATKLLAVYDKCDIVTMIDFKTAKNDKAQNLYNDMFETNVVEAILSQDVIINKLNNQEKVSLARVAEEKLEQKLEETEIFSEASILSSIDILSNKKISTYASTYDGYLFGRYGYVNKTVKTPKGSKVKVFNVKQDMTASEANSYKKQVEKQYPTVKFINKATTKYNCHSFAWYSMSGKYWMDNPKKYISDGSYVKCQSKKNAKMIYKNNGEIDHSGIISNVYFGPSLHNFVDMVSVKSKWGRLGLYEHGGICCPYYNDNTKVKYYSRAN